MTPTCTHAHTPTHIDLSCDCAYPRTFQPDGTLSPPDSPQITGLVDDLDALDVNPLLSRRATADILRAAGIKHDTNNLAAAVAWRKLMLQEFLDDYPDEDVRTLWRDGAGGRGTKPFPAPLV